MGGSVCQPWATIEDVLRCDCLPDDYDSYLLDEMLDAASSMLNRKIGFLFPGVCTEVVRPCGQGTDGYASFHGSSLGPWSSWGWNSSWGFCGCHLQARACSCCGPAEITVGAYPIVEIIEVLLDGVPFTDYSISDDGWLQRNDGNSWPCCQNLALPDTEEGTFSVTFTAGIAAPIEAKLAAASWACDLYRACIPGDGEDCGAIPLQISGLVRESATYQFRTTSVENLQAGFVGNDTADAFLATYMSTDPEPADIWSPEVGAPVRRLR